MALLCIIAGLFQLVTLLAVTGVLVSVAAVSRMMELTIIFIHPTSIFFLRQSNKLVLYGINLMVVLTVHVFRELCPQPHQAEQQSELNSCIAVETISASDLPREVSEIQAEEISTE